MQLLCVLYPETALVNVRCGFTGGIDNKGFDEIRYTN